MSFPNGLTGQQLLNFIGGRKSYNSRRQMMAIDRRWKVLSTWAENPHLNKADLARRFKVSKATITRDIAYFKTDGRRGRFPKCPMCEGKGRIDTGPDLATTVEVVSDIKRAFSHLFGA